MIERRSHRRHRGVAGNTLIEVIGATALAGVVLASATAGVTNAVRILRAQVALARRLEIARARLEAELAAPCSDIVACAEDLRCTIARELVAAPSANGPGWLVRVHSDVAARGSDQTVLRVTTLDRRAAVCP